MGEGVDFAAPVGGDVGEERLGVFGGEVEVAVVDGADYDGGQPFEAAGCGLGCVGGTVRGRVR